MTGSRCLKPEIVRSVGDAEPAARVPCLPLTQLFGAVYTAQKKVWGAKGRVGRGDPRSAWVKEVLSSIPQGLTPPWDLVYIAKQLRRPADLSERLGNLTEFSSFFLE